MTGADLQHAVEQFYYREARLLDERRYRTWLGLLDPNIRYVVPSRVNIMIDNRMQGDEDMLGVARELEDQAGMGAPVREESLLHLQLRAERAYRVNAWAEHPPARTRRIVGNVQVLGDEAGVLEVVSAFHLHYARPGGGTFSCSGERQDLLVRGDPGFTLRQRTVVLDYDVIDLPTLGLFF